MAGRRSSLLVAKIVLLIAVSKAEALMLKEVVSSAPGSLGKLSGFSPITLYLPLSLVISIAKFLSIWKVSGWSPIFFNESIKMRAGIQTLPASFASISNCTRITVSKSVATTVSLFFSTSKRKSSRMGRTVLVLMTPEICCNCLRSTEEFAMNFIQMLL